jgi:hypothetical protein
MRSKWGRKKSTDCEISQFSDFQVHLSDFEEVRRKVEESLTEHSERFERIGMVWPSLSDASPDFVLHESDGVE